MALIPPGFLDGVVAIGFLRNETVQYSATGFLYGNLLERGDTPQTSKYRAYLVTNRHVFEHETTAYIRFNPRAAEPAKVYDLSLKDADGKLLWHAHPNASVDVAAATLNVKLLEEHGIQFAMFLSDQHVLPRAKALDAGVFEGDGVFILGFPLGLVGEERNYVIVRSGVIARIRDALSGGSNEFLVDASIFPGNSGGPVVTRPEAIAITGTKSLSSTFLIGVVSSYVPYHDVAISQQTKRPRIVFEENSGLAAVVPIDLVIEVVAQAEKTIATLAQPATPPEPAA